MATKPIIIETSNQLITAITDGIHSTVDGETITFKACEFRYTSIASFNDPDVKSAMQSRGIVNVTFMEGSDECRLQIDPNYLFKGNDYIKSIDIPSPMQIGYGPGYRNNFSNLCEDCTALESFKAENNGDEWLNCSNFNCMFKNCSNLTSFTLGYEADNGHCTADEMFMNCTSLTSFISRELSLYPSSCKRMFAGCKNLESLAIPYFMIENIEGPDQIEGFLDGCSNLRTLIVNKNTFDPTTQTIAGYKLPGLISRVEEIEYEDTNCYQITFADNLVINNTEELKNAINNPTYCTVDGNKYSFQFVTFPFESTAKFIEVDTLPDTYELEFTNSEIFSRSGESGVWRCNVFNYNEKIERIKFDNTVSFIDNTNNNTKALLHLFNSCYNLKYANVWDTLNFESATDCQSMFYNTDLEVLNINWLSSIGSWTSVSNLFVGNKNAKSIVWPENNLIQSWDLGAMFQGCNSIPEKIVVPPLNCPYLQSISSLFGLIESKTTPGIIEISEGFSAPKCNDFSSALNTNGPNYFSSDVKFIFPESNPFASNDINVSELFNNRSGLTEFTFPYEISCSNAAMAFQGCSNLKSVDMRKVSMSNGADMTNFLEGTNKLKTLILKTSDYDEDNNQIYGLYTLPKLVIKKEEIESGVTELTFDGILEIHDNEDLLFVMSLPSHWELSGDVYTIYDCIFAKDSTASFSDDEIKQEMIGSYGLHFSNVWIYENAARLFSNNERLRFVNISGILRCDLNEETGEWNIDHMFENCINLGGTLSDDFSYGCNLYELNLEGLTSAAYAFHNTGITSCDMEWICKDNVSVSLVDVSFVYSECKSIDTPQDFATSKFPKLKYAVGMFAGSSINSIVIPEVSAEELVDVSGMFMDCKQLTYIEVSEHHFLAPKLCKFDYFFKGCSSLTGHTYGASAGTTIYIPENIVIAANNVSMNSYLEDCTALQRFKFTKSVNLSSSSNMLKGCTNLYRGTIVGMNFLTINNSENIDGMLEGSMEKIEYIKLRNDNYNDETNAIKIADDEYTIPKKPIKVDEKEITELTFKIEYFEILTNKDLEVAIQDDTYCTIEDTTYTFKYCRFPENSEAQFRDIEDMPSEYSIVFDNVEIYESAEDLFSLDSRITSVSFSENTVLRCTIHSDEGWGLTNAFKRCYALTNVDMSSVNLDGLINADNMFESTGVTEADLSWIPRAKDLESIGYMFYYCGNATTITWPEPQTVLPNIQNAEGLFASSGIESTSIPPLILPKLTTVEYMFDVCSQLNQIIIENGLVVPNLVTANYMFLDVHAPNIEIGNNIVISKDNMTFKGFLENNYSIETFTLPEEVHAHDVSEMFLGCENLRYIDLRHTFMEKMDSEELFTEFLNGCTSLEILRMRSDDINENNMIRGVYSLDDVGIDVLEVVRDGEYANVYFGEKLDINSHEDLEKALNDERYHVYNDDETVTFKHLIFPSDFGFNDEGVPELLNNRTSFIFDDVTVNGSSERLFTGSTYIKSIIFNENCDVRPNYNSEDETWTLAEFFNGCSSLENVDISCVYDYLDTCTSMNGLFSGTKLQVIDLSFMDGLSSLESMANLCYDCSELMFIKLPNVTEYPKLSDANYLLSTCPKLLYAEFPEELDLPELVSIEDMFSNDSSLLMVKFPSTLTVPKLNSAAEMFISCNSLLKVEFPEELNLPNLTSMSSMFDGCSSLISLSIPHFTNLAALTDMSNMFYGCSSLENITIRSDNYSELSFASDMFKNCSNVENIDIRNISFNMTDPSNLENFLEGCANLETITMKKSEYDASTKSIKGLYTFPKEVKSTKDIDENTILISFVGEPGPGPEPPGPTPAPTVSSQKKQKGLDPLVMLRLQERRLRMEIANSRNHLQRMNLIKELQKILSLIDWYSKMR